jgi:hypothetical protein
MWIAAYTTCIMYNIGMEDSRPGVGNLFMLEVRINLAEIK